MYTSLYDLKRISKIYKNFKFINLEQKNLLKNLFSFVL